MHRIDVIHRALQANGGDRYLEVGVSRGVTFAKIQAATKVAVDPAFKFRVPATGRARTIAKRRTGDLYFGIESDEFFRVHGARLAPFDAALLDGLHTAEQTYRDIVNTATLLSPNGLIVVHDCSPKTAAAAAPTLDLATTMPGYDGAWNGDVFKSIIRVRQDHPELEAFVLDTDHGLGLVRRLPADEAATRPAYSSGRSVEQLMAMTFEELAGERVALLDLRPPDAVDEVIAAITATTAP